MQHTLTNVRAHPLRIERDGDAANTVDLDTVVRGARRQWKVLAASVAATSFLAVIYIALATKMYTGTSNVLIDPRIFTSAPKDEQAGLLVSETALDSQVEIISSQKIALTVINKLDLFNDPEFVRPSLFAKILSLIDLSKQLSPEETKAAKEARALDRFADRLTVVRTNKTFVLEIDFLSQVPKKAADIANAIATAYVSDEVEARQEAATRASTWIREQIVELKRKSAEADLAVQQYRESNALITAGGRLINDQQLSELNSQVSNARADLARAQAKYDHIQAIIANKEVSATVSEELSSPVITDLRTHYFKVAKRKGDLLAARVGQNHDMVLNAERQMREIESQILEELGRIAESYRSDLEVARGREKSLSENLALLVGSSANDNRTAIDLRQHQQSVEAYQILYEKSLQRYEELLHQQSITMTETRVIAQARLPISPSAPKLILVLAVALFGGITIGTGAAIYREYRDRTFRRHDQIQFELDLDFLGVLPLQTADIIEKYAGSRAPKNADIFPSIPANFKICAAYPFSRFADTMGAIKVALDSRRDTETSKVIGVVSTVQGEGKTVTSANLALFCALTGAKTLLIDADLRRCDLSTKLAPGALSSIGAVIRGDVGISETLKQLSEHLWFLPAGKACETVNSSELVRSDGMKRLLVTGADLFDYIVIDLPPLLSMVDGRAIEPLVTQFLYIVEWGTVPRHVVRDALSQNITVYKKCLGVVLNKVDRKLISRYASGDAHGYQYNMYS